jgi:hypothetical protein
LSWLQNAHAHRSAPLLVVHRSAGAEDCADTRTLALAVAALMRAPRVLVLDGPTDQRIDVHIARNDHGYAARIELRGTRAGTRELNDAGPSCAGLEDALALTIALLLDELPAQAPVRRVVRDAPPAVQRRAMWAAGAEAGAGMTIGIAGTPWPAVGAQGELRLRPMWALSAGALFSPPRAIELPPGEVVVMLIAGVARGCVTLPDSFDRNVAPWLCLVGAAGGVSGEGVGYAANVSQSRPWIAAGASLGVDGRIGGPLRWRIRGTWLAQVQEQFAVDLDGDGTIAERELALEPPPVAFLLESGFAALWP